MNSYPKTATDILRECDYYLEYVVDKNTGQSKLMGPIIDCEVIFSVEDDQVFMNGQPAYKGHPKTFQAIVYIAICKIAEKIGYPPKYIIFPEGPELYLLLNIPELTPEELEESDDLLSFAIDIVDGGIPIERIPHYKDNNLLREIQLLVFYYYELIKSTNDD